MKLNPLGDRVVVKPKNEKEIKSGNIYLPATGQDQYVQGEVIAVGLGGRTLYGSLIPMQVKVGDFVIFGKTPWGEIMVGGESMIVLREGEILAVVES